MVRIEDHMLEEFKRECGAELRRHILEELFYFLKREYGVSGSQFMSHESIYWLKMFGLDDGEFL